MIGTLSGPRIAGRHANPRRRAPLALCCVDAIQPQEAAMSDHEVKMIILSTDDLDESIRFYSETLGMSLKFRDGAHFAALDGGSVTLALATAVDHPIPGQVVVGIKTADVDAAAKAIEPAAAASRPRTPTHTSVAPWSTTTRATAWSSTRRWRADTRRSARNLARVADEIDRVLIDEGAP